jgi:glycosyltransferase involved in cell wall biosynthesis
MRVIHLLNHTRRLNGHVHAALDLACAQTKLGHAVTIASGGGDFDEFLARNAVETALISVERRPGSFARALSSLHSLVKLRKPDLIHAHMVTSAILAWPVCKAARIPLVTTVHNEFEKRSILMGIGTRVIAVSAAVGRSMASRGIPPSRIDVVLNGTIGAARLKDKDRAPLALPYPAILSVGGQHPRKGLPDLFEAFEIVNKKVAARLYVVGGGPLLSNYVAMVKRMSCADAVNFAGPQDNPYPWMTGADVFVLPSHADPAPLVLSEAREARCAIVATEVDGIPELLDNGAAGILVPPREPGQLARAISSLLEMPGELERWKANSQIGLDYLHVERVARETLAVYEKACGRSDFSDDDLNAKASFAKPPRA